MLSQYGVLALEYEQLCKVLESDKSGSADPTGGALEVTGGALRYFLAVPRTASQDAERSKKKKNICNGC